ncbi:hypothetical protein Tco_0583165 [Tanacetum coccineum]
MLPLGEHSSHWANLLREIVRGFPIHFGSSRIIPLEQKVGVLRKIKIYTDNKSSLKRDYWVKNPDDETYDAEAIRSRRPGSRTLAALQDRQSPTTQEYPSLIQTFFDIHTVGGVFLWDEDRRLYGLGTYTNDQIMAMVRGGKQRGHIPGVGRVLEGRGKDVLDVPAMCSDDRYSQLFTQLQSQHESESGAIRDNESSDDEDADEDEEDVDS